MKSAPVLIVLSGGQDSTTCLFLAKRDNPDSDIHAITFDYGQRHRIEIQSAIRVAEMARVSSHVIRIIPREILESTSPLVTGNQLEQYENFNQMNSVIGDRIEKTFVPMRNALFLTIAANRAAALGCRDIYTGVSAEDNANYPDCRIGFIEATEKTITEALGLTFPTRIRIRVPLINKTKADTVRLAHSMPECWEAMAWTHTSYDGQFPPTDMNHANVLRAQGFLEAGLPDPLVMRAVRQGVMVLPNTSNYNNVTV